MIQFKCSCGKVLKVRPEFESRKLQCPACESLIRIRRAGGSNQAAVGAPAEKQRRKKRTKAADTTGEKRRRQQVSVPDDDIEVIEDIDDLELIEDIDDFEELDDFAFADEGDADEELDGFAAAALPRAKKKKKPAKGKSKPKKEDEVDDGSSSGLSPKVMYPLFGFAGLVMILLVALVVRSVQSSSEAYARSQAVPETFSSWTHNKGILTSDYPDGFEVSGGVGAGGTAPWAKFENKDQGVVIMVRASLSGSAISTMMTAESSGMGARDLVDPEQQAIDQVKEMHRFQFEKMCAEYDSYDEVQDRILDCKLGKGCVSQFSGSKVFLKAQGLRGTLLGSQYQYNVICKCPADRIEEYTPVFEHVIKSVGG